LKPKLIGLVDFWTNYKLLLKCTLKTCNNYSNNTVPNGPFKNRCRVTSVETPRRVFSRVKRRVVTTFSPLETRSLSLPHGESEKPITVFCRQIIQHHRENGVEFVYILFVIYNMYTCIKRKTNKTIGRHH